MLLLQQEDRKLLLRTQHNQLLQEAKSRGSATNIDRSNSPVPCESLNDEQDEPVKSGTPEFRRNPFTLVKKKSLKQMSATNYLKAEKMEVKKGKNLFDAAWLIIMKFCFERDFNVTFSLRKME